MASKMMIPAACTIVVLVASYGIEATIGMNWGRQSAQRLLPSQVVDLMLQNGIGNARVYTAQKDILAAFAGSGINLTVTIFNPLSVKSMETARAWIEERKEFFIPSKIRAIYIGGYVFDKGRDKAYLASSMNALRWMQGALNERQLGQQVKANFLHYGLALKPNKTKPSEGEFLDELKEEMIEYLQFLQENDAPFPIQLFPVMEAIEMENFDITFAFPDGKSNRVVTDINGFVYTNVVEWKYDSFVWALSKLNASNIKIIIAQVGWPTDGYPGANVANAERFFKHLLPLVASNKGTPMRPGAPIDISIHALTDETKMSTAVLTRHWGIYRSNGEPKYKIDLSGQGRDIYPSTIKGIMHMPRRWCMFNGDRRDLEKVNRLFDWACSNTDCSSLAPGGSCSKLSFEQNVSFAFNVYFQFQFQDESACDFDGLAGLSVEDPSTEDCVFPVEVVKGQQDNYVPSANYGFRQSPNLALFVFWVWILVFSKMLFFM